MKTFRRAYLLGVIVFGLLIYAFLLGDAGYLVRSSLHKEYSDLERKLNDLEEENHLLNERYNTIQKEIRPNSGEQLQTATDLPPSSGDSAVSGSAIILKFEQDRSDSWLDETQEKREWELHQIRIYYLFSITFLVAFGLLFLRPGLLLSLQSGTGEKKKVYQALHHSQTDP